jgi:rod shape determining protein RodA
LKARVGAWAGDPPLVLAVLFLSLFGAAMIYSAGVVNVPSPNVAGAWKRQLVWLVLALATFATVSRIRLRWFEWAAWPSYVLAMILLAATLVIGTGGGASQGVQRWIDLGGFRFQPSEVAKLATILAMARLLSARKESPRNFRDLVAPVSVVTLPFGLVMLQPDLGTAFAFVGILFAILFWAGTPVGLLFLMASPAIGLILSFSTWIWSVYMVGLVLLLYLYRYRLYLVEWLGVGLANLAAGTIALPVWQSLKEYQRNRLLIFLDPNSDPQGAGWNLIQSKVAIGSGGLSGKGYTLGTQKRLDFLPEQHTDFIFSVIGEELGFIGTTLTLVVFGYALYRLIRMAEGADDPFAGLVLFGIFGSWLVHIFVNVGMTIGLVPVTGIPLPFVSYGGTFLLMSWIAVALAVRVASDDGG